MERRSVAPLQAGVCGSHPRPASSLPARGPCCPVLPPRTAGTRTAAWQPEHHLCLWTQCCLSKRVKWDFLSSRQIVRVGSCLSALGRSTGGWVAFPVSLTALQAHRWPSAVTGASPGRWGCMASREGGCVCVCETFDILICFASR